MDHAQYHVRWQTYPVDPRGLTLSDQGAGTRRIFPAIAAAGPHRCRWRVRYAPKNEETCAKLHMRPALITTAKPFGGVHRYCLMALGRRAVRSRLPIFCARGSSQASRPVLLRLDRATTARASRGASGCGRCPSTLPVVVQRSIQRIAVDAPMVRRRAASRALSLASTIANAGTLRSPEYRLAIATPVVVASEAIRI